MKEAPMKGKLIKPAVVAVTIAGALLVAGGIAYATIPDSSGVIRACYKVDPKGNLDGNATLRLIDPSATKPPDSTACKNNEQPLDWNQTGPQGQSGPQGATGATGPTGPSDVYSVDGYGQPVKGISPSPTVWEDLATTPTLPAGSYFVQSEVEIENSGSVLSEYFCDLVDSSTNEYQTERATADSNTNWVIVPVQAVITLASPDTITFRCSSNSSFGSEAFNWQLAAIKVGTVHP
jgi:hypothetical protein